MTEEELLAEEYICNGKCQDDITRNYVHCKTCTRLKDFLAGYKARKAELEKENAELKAFKEKCKFNVSDICKDIETENNLTKAKELLKRWVELSKPKLEGYPITPIQEQTEQFLKDCEVEK